MAKEFKFGIGRKIANKLISIFARTGLGPKGLHLLTVPGRKSGIPRTTPVQLVIDDGDRWLVAPYGEVEWVKNARAAGRVILTRGSRSETVGLEKAPAQQSGVILKRYVKQVGPIVYPYFDATPKDPPDAFAREAERHPVFRIVT